MFLPRLSFQPVNERQNLQKELHAKLTKPQFLLVLAFRLPVSESWDNNFKISCLWYGAIGRQRTGFKLTNECKTKIMLMFYDANRDPSCREGRTDEPTIDKKLATKWSFRQRKSVLDRSAGRHTIFKSLNPSFIRIVVSSPH